MNEERAQAIIRQAGIDAVVVTRPENVRYLTGLPLDLPISLDLPVAAVLYREPFGVADIVAPRATAGSIPAEATETARIRMYGRFYARSGERERLRPTERTTLGLLETAHGEDESFDDAVRSAVAGLPASASMAWDDPRLRGILSDQGRSPSADGDALMRRIRRVKTPVEVDRIQRAAATAEGVELDLIAASTPGADWADIARSVPHLVTGRGGSPGFFTGGASWQAGFMYAPQSLTLAEGDLIRLDLGLSVDGYWADTGRTVSLGEPSTLARRRYAAIRAAVESVIDAVRPGVSFAALYEIAMNQVRPTIPDFRRHHCGHTIGLRAYEGELIAADEHGLLEVGMTINVEVPYYEIGWGGLQLEETILVEPDGCRALTTLGRDMFVAPGRSPADDGIASAS
jgi:Xaa-Pro dipeptidase